MPPPHHFNGALHAGPVARPGPVLPPGPVLVLAVRLRGRGEGPVPGLCAAQFGTVPQRQAGPPGSGHGRLPVLQERQRNGNDRPMSFLLVGGFPPRQLILGVFTLGLHTLTHTTPTSFCVSLLKISPPMRIRSSFYIRRVLHSIKISALIFKELINYSLRLQDHVQCTLIDCVVSHARGLAPVMAQSVGGSTVWI